jgi:hypothetical protein
MLLIKPNAMDTKMAREKRSGPWWVWLLLVLFPIPVGFCPWWVTATFLAGFVVTLWGIKPHLENNSSKGQ